MFMLCRVVHFNFGFISSFKESRWLWKEVSSCLLVSTLPLPPTASVPYCFSDSTSCHSVSMSTCKCTSLLYLWLRLVLSNVLQDWFIIEGVYMWSYCCFKKEQKEKKKHCVGAVFSTRRHHSFECVFEHRNVPYRNTMNKHELCSLRSPITDCGSTCSWSIMQVLTWLTPHQHKATNRWSKKCNVLLVWQQIWALKSEVCECVWECYDVCVWRQIGCSSCLVVDLYSFISLKQTKRR